MKKLFFLLMGVGFVFSLHGQISLEPGRMAVNWGLLDPNSNLFVSRDAAIDGGAGKANIYALRQNNASGGSGWLISQVDAVIKGYSTWGNPYTAAVVGYNFLDYSPSAAVIGVKPTSGASPYVTKGALCYNDGENYWAGFFDGDVRIIARDPSTEPSAPVLKLDVVREYEDQGEFGKWHELKVLPSASSLSGDHYAFYQLGDKNNYWTYLYSEQVFCEKRLGVGLTGTQADIHLYQSDYSYPDPGTGGIIFQIFSGGNHKWQVWNSYPSLSFAYQGSRMAYISSVNGAWTTTSDRRYKKNISKLEPVLEKVMQLKPSRYQFVRNEGDGGWDIGFIAQEVEEVFPGIPKTEGGRVYALSYKDFAVLAIAAIQEQHQIVEEQEAEIEDLKEANRELLAEVRLLRTEDDRMQRRLDQMSNQLIRFQAILEGCCHIGEGDDEGKASEEMDRPYLLQNQPNPFDTETLIQFYIPESAQTASLKIADLNGKVLKQFPVGNRNKGDILVKGQELSPGTYVYMLIVDDERVDVKKMVLTR